ncbi:hypothetical protein EBR03_01310 [bacterium]|nr:hypothetical protein [bacterium]NBW98187.1 hypothetical protein [bacterium]NBX82166.1 hypothetical protein [bacterium]
MKLFALAFLLLGIIPSLALSELRDAAPPLSPTMAGMTLIGASGEPQVFRGPEANAAAQAANTAAAMAAQAGQHGSRAAEAIAAAAQAGLLYKMLMDKGVMDEFQRKEMNRSLEVLNKKVEALQKEVNSGKMSQAEFAAIRAAVEEAYAKNSKFNAQKDKEVAPNQPQGPSEKTNGSAVNGEATLNAKASELQKALEGETGVLPKDIAQMGNLGVPELQNGKALTADPTASGKGLLEGPRNQERGALTGSSGSGWMPMQQPSNTHINIENSSGSLADSKNRASESGLARDMGSFGGAGYFGEAQDEDIVAPNFEATGGSALEMGETPSRERNGESEPVLGWFGQGLKGLLKPIKIQKNPLSTQLQNEEGIHPLVLLALMAGFIWLGIRLSQKDKKKDVVVPEVILGRESIPLSRSTEIMIPQRRADRRFQQRV